MNFIIKVNSPKQIMVTPTLAPIVIQNPSFGSKYGNSKNMGIVGITYQKV